MKAANTKHLPSMARVGNTVGNPTMTRVNLHNSLILREAFDNRKAFLTFDYSPNAVIMSTNYLIRGREIPFAVMLLLFLMHIPAMAQSPEMQTVFEKYLKQAKQDTFSYGVRKRFLKVAYNSLKWTEEDSLKYSRMSKIVEISSHLQDSLFFLDLASEGLKLANELGNKSLIGDAHWNYGSYYLGLQKYERSYYHYNRAYTFFMESDSEYYAGKMLYNMAYIASETNDLTGAEILLFKSIKIFERIPKLQQVYRCYNILGNNADDMGEYEKSLVYYNRAAELIPSLEKPNYYQVENWNNLGVRLYKMKLYRQAIRFFDEALEQKEVLMENPSLHAKLMDNRAFCLVSLGMYAHVEQPMKHAISLRDSLGEVAGGVTSRLRFSNYYGKTGDSLNAITYAFDALKLAKAHFLSRDVLDALEQLAAFDKDNAIFYLSEHIELNKQMNVRDRNLRNKFTAIQYETDNYIQENEKLFRQRLWISIGALTTTILLLLIYWNTKQGAKNEQLLFEKEQQQLNADLILMALEQKNNLQKGRKIERLRISRELHDSIISKVLAIRLKLEEIFFSHEKTKPIIAQRHIRELEEVETEIRNISHNLRNRNLWYDQEFLEIMEQTIKAKSEIANFEYVYHSKDSEAWEDLDDLSKMHIGRMLEEILQNIYKHAGAKLVMASFKTGNNNFVISIQDNGKGFNDKKKKTGIGLKNLMYRTEQLNGTLNISSKIDQGTTIKITIPFNK